jgi:hypothetical protein
MTMMTPDTLLPAISLTLLLTFGILHTAQHTPPRPTRTQLARTCLWTTALFASAVTLLISLYGPPDAPTPDQIFILVVPDPSAPAEGILLPWDPTAPIPNMPAPHLLQG